MVAACAQSGTPGPATTTPGRTSGTVTWITDGDTVDVDTSDDVLTVRLSGINAPDQGECFYDQALDHLVETLKGKRVTLEIAGTDQFDRTLAHVLAGERHVNLDMVVDGLALASPSGDDRHGAAVIEAEEQAFTSRNGLWAETACGDDVPPGVEIDPGSSTTDPQGPDNDFLESESVTVVSRADAPVDLGGWVLRDGSSRHRFTFPEGSSLEQGGRITVTSADPGWSPGGEAVWNNGGDVAILVNRSGNVVSRWRY